MKKLLIGALCIFSACQPKPNNPLPNQKPVRVGIITYQKQDSIAIQTTVKVVDYNKNLFKVYTLAGHFYAGAGSGMFYGAQEIDIDRYMHGYCDTIKFIVSKPVTEDAIDKIKIYQFNICREALETFTFYEQRKKQLNAIANRKSGNGGIPQRTKDFSYNILWGKHTGYAVNTGCCNVILGDLKHQNDIKLSMVWDIDYNYVKRVCPKCVPILKRYERDYVGHDTEEQRKQFITYLETIR